MYVPNLNFTWTLRNNFSHFQKGPQKKSSRVLDPLNFTWTPRNYFLHFQKGPQKFSWTPRILEPALPLDNALSLPSHEYSNVTPMASIGMRHYWIMIFISILTAFWILRFIKLRWQLGLNSLSFIHLNKTIHRSPWSMSFKVFGHLNDYFLVKFVNLSSIFLQDFAGHPVNDYLLATW